MANFRPAVSGALRSLRHSTSALSLDPPSLPKLPSSLRLDTDVRSRPSAPSHQSFQRLPRPEAASSFPRRLLSTGRGGAGGGGGGGDDDGGPSPPATTATTAPPGGGSAYVHPLSQIVLEHLQSSRGEWLSETGLNAGFELRGDGTFVLRFPPPVGGAAAAAAAASTVEGGGGGGSEDDDDDGGPSDGVWTSYDPDEKKHWLTVRRGELVGRYLMQDNLRPAWHSDRRSTPEKVQDAVDEMIRKIEEADGGGGGTGQSS